MSKSFYETYWNQAHRTDGFSLHVLRTAVSEESVLDLGCGDGAHLKLLREQNVSRRLHGIDVSSDAVARAKADGISAEVGDITQLLPFEDDSFEAVLLFDVLEHFLEPEKILAEAARVASKAVYVSVPNFVSLPARVQVLRGLVPENNSRSKGHVYWFTRSVLRDMLTKVGLKVEREYTHTFWQGKPVLRNLVGIGLKLAPSLFSLSFVVKAVRKDAL